MDSLVLLKTLTQQPFNYVCEDLTRTKAYKIKLSETETFYIKNKRSKDQKADLEPITGYPLVIHPKFIKNIERLISIEGINLSPNKNGFVKSSGYSDFPKPQDGTSPKGLAINVASIDGLKELLSMVLNQNQDWTETNESKKLERLIQPLKASSNNLESYAPTDNDIEKFNGLDELTMRAIKSRRGQSDFRKSLLLAFNNTCCITHCKVKPLLEAAHIIPHKDETNYSIYNGLLLRSDIHTLFDLGLLNVSELGRVSIDRTLKESEYFQYDGITLDNQPPIEMSIYLEQRLKNSIGSSTLLDLENEMFN